MIYLPGVSRGSVAEASALDDSLTPLAEIAIRSNWWPSAFGQAPWTPHSFLGSKQGPGFDFSADAATKAALGEVLEQSSSRSVDDPQAQGEARLVAVASPRAR